GAEFHGQGTGEGIDPELGEGVVEPRSGRVHVGGGGGLVDDGAAAPGFHQRRGGAGDVEHAVHVHFEEAVVIGEVDVHRRLVLHAGEDGGVVHQVVDAAKVARHGVGEGLTGVGCGDIGLDEQRLAALAVDG